MRDAFGGTFMIQIFLVFIFVYICFTAISLNYARAFKVKSTIIEYLETNEISSVDPNDMSAEEQEEFNEFINQEVFRGLKYSISNPDFCSKVKHDVDEPEPYCNPIGIIIRQTNSTGAISGVYYTVFTYVNWNTGFLKPLLSLGGNANNQNSIEGTWEISGQSRVITRKNP